MANRVDHIIALFEGALQLGAEIVVYEAHTPEALETLLRWAAVSGLRAQVELVHRPHIGSWRMHRVHHARCSITIIGIVDQSTKVPTDGKWRPTDASQQ